MVDLTRKKLWHLSKTIREVEAVQRAFGSLYWLRWIQITITRLALKSLKLSLYPTTRWTRNMKNSNKTISTIISPKTNLTLSYTVTQAKLRLLTTSLRTSFPWVPLTSPFHNLWFQVNWRRSNLWKWSKSPSLTSLQKMVAVKTTDRDHQWTLRATMILQSWRRDRVRGCQWYRDHKKRLRLEHLRLSTSLKLAHLKFNLSRTDARKTLRCKRPSCPPATAATTILQSSSQVARSDSRKTMSSECQEDKLARDLQLRSHQVWRARLRYPTDYSRNISEAQLKSLKELTQGIPWLPGNLLESLPSRSGLRRRVTSSQPTQTL